MGKVVMILFMTASWTLIGQSYDFEIVGAIPTNTYSLGFTKDNKGKNVILSQNGVYLEQTGSYKHSYSGQSVSAFADDANDAWISINQHIINLSLGKLLATVTTSKVTALLVHQRQLYIGKEDGLYRLNIATEKIEELTTRNSGFNKSGVNFLHKDIGGAVWVGTTNGDYRFKDNKWKQYNKGKKVLDAVENEEGTWFISTDDIWLVDKDNRYYPVGLDEDLIKGKLNDFAIDKKGTLYFASDVLVSYHPRTNKIIRYADNGSGLTQKASALGIVNGDLWIGTKGVGVYKIILKTEKTDIDAPISANIKIEKSPTCPESNNGAIEVIINGGKPPYTIEWSNKETTAKIKNLAPSLYTITVRDSQGASTQKSIDLTSNNSPIIEVTTVKLPTSDGVKGSISLKAEGLTLVWSTGAKTNEITNLSEGNYSVVATDKNGCKTTKDFILELQKVAAPAKVDSLKNADTKVVATKPEEKPSNKSTLPIEKSSPILNNSEVAAGKTFRLEKIFFKADSINILPEVIPSLEGLLTFLRDNKNIKAEIGGHTNTIPPDEYCDKLSTGRAFNIAKYLYDRGISPTQLSYKGYGKRKPLTQDKSEKGRQLNQRVELTILAK
jgi:outer membrane protein OmpA-like peptidoglycan-associated protein